MTDTKQMREAALKYYDAGHFVIPCKRGEKRPLVKWGGVAKRLSRKALAAFWKDGAEPPDIALRLDDRTLILDLDPIHNPNVTKLYDELLESTQCATTPSDGLHAWYRVGKRVSPRTYKGMDVLTKGRMVVVPPSEGREWLGQTKPSTAHDPSDLIARVIKQAGIQPLAPGEGLARDALASLDKIPVHRRNHTLTAIAGVLRAAGFRGNRLEGALQGIVDRVVEQPENDLVAAEDVARICESIDWRRPSPFDTRDMTRYEFDTQDEPPKLDWLIRDFLPAEGVTSLFGLGKQGKSYIAMEALRCLATASPFLDIAVAEEPRRVLYVDWEKRGSSLRRRLHALAKDDRIHVTVMEPHGALVAMIDPLRAEVELGGYHLAIIDSLTIALMQGDVNEAATVVPALFALNSLGCPVLALDHTKKPAFGEPYEALTAFGSVFKANVCSMNWRLKKISGDAVGMSIVLQHVSNNYDVAPQDIHANIGFEFGMTGSLDNVRITRTDVSAADNLIWRHLSNQTEPLLAKEIADHLNLSLPQARRTLSKLAEDRLVAQQGKDYWVALEPADEEGDA